MTGTLTDSFYNQNLGDKQIENVLVNKEKHIINWYEVFCYLDAYLTFMVSSVSAL